MLRTHTCGELMEKDIGREVELCGWVDTVRDHGGLLFIDLRDRYGKTQLVASGAGWVVGHSFKPEDYVRVKGKVQRRPKGTENPNLLTGQIEVAIEFPLLDSTTCKPLPFEVVKSRETNEDLRLKYRFLDLRNPAVQKNLFARHKAYQAIRRALDERHFIEVETPILTKSTPEGARDYLVPSRLNQGEFYALPQSPQLFKQLLMVSGFDRYFQIAKCFRDEDLRADRQPEFTQLDMEMSFITEEDVFTVVEKVLEAIFKEVLNQDLKTPFRRLSYQEAINQYGTDKPDLRFDLAVQCLNEIAADSEFKVFKDVVSKTDGAVVGICVPQGGSASRKDIDTLTDFVKNEGALGLAYFKVVNGALDSPISKFFTPNVQGRFIQKFAAADGDLILLIADELKKAIKIAGALRLYAAKRENLVDGKRFDFNWVTDFPLFQWNEEEKHWESEHHPFTSPNMEDWVKYKKTGELGKIRSSAYDLVLNGSEIGSGSIRIHRRSVQQEVFEAIGLGKEEIERRFGFLLRAFEFGAPPHGGIALGVDRLLTILLGLDSIREVIAFPKNQKAVCPMTEAPSPVAAKQLKELGIKIA
ncbi:MAG: aspartate--tRNA ligase [Candidatus Omnitrophica bacterium]|nr:aspartate--tRNA ligase [Candidatus Omnitrophota bacterium]